MWEHTLVTTTDVSAAALWAVAADDESRPVRELGRFARRTVEESRPPSRLVVTAALVLARTRTVYEFRPVAGGTRVGVAVQLLGPLRFLYSRSVGRRMGRGLSPLVRQLIERARATTATRAAGRPAPAGASRSA